MNTDKVSQAVKEYELFLDDLYSYRFRLSLDADDLAAMREYARDLEMGW